MNAAPRPSIRLEGVAKAFESRLALADIDLRIDEGSYVALMGANGAGKTTLLRIMAGLASPTRGTVRIAGVDLRRASARIRSLIGVVSHETMLYADLTARENLVFHARLFGLDDYERLVARTAEVVGAGHALDRPVRTLSRGTRQRVSLARAFLHDPPILLLDEPFTGLDPRSADVLMGRLAALRDDRERTVVLVSHDLARAAQLGDAALVLQRGRVALEASGASLTPDLLAQALASPVS